MLNKEEALKFRQWLENSEFDKIINFWYGYIALGSITTLHGIRLVVCKNKSRLTPEIKEEMIELFMKIIDWNESFLSQSDCLDCSYCLDRQCCNVRMEKYIEFLKD